MAFAEELSLYAGNGVDKETWWRFLDKIGAQEKSISQAGDDVYTVYLKQKQDKQLIMIDKMDEQGNDIVRQCPRR